MKRTNKFTDEAGGEPTGGGATRTLFRKKCAVAGTLPDLCYLQGELDFSSA
jgi:hypothetical protein